MARPERRKKRWEGKIPSEAAKLRPGRVPPILRALSYRAGVPLPQNIAVDLASGESLSDYSLHEIVDGHHRVSAVGRLSSLDFSAMEQRLLSQLAMLPEEVQSARVWTRSALRSVHTYHVPGSLLRQFDNFAVQAQNAARELSYFAEAMNSLDRNVTSENGSMDHYIHLPRLDRWVPDDMFHLSTPLAFESSATEPATTITTVRGFIGRAACDVIGGDANLERLDHVNVRLESDTIRRYLDCPVSWLRQQRILDPRPVPRLSQVRRSHLLRVLSLNHWGIFDPPYERMRLWSRDQQESLLIQCASEIAVTVARMGTAFDSGSNLGATIMHLPASLSGLLLPDSMLERFLTVSAPYFFMSLLCSCGIPTALIERACSAVHRVCVRYFPTAPVDAPSSAPEPKPEIADRALQLPPSRLPRSVLGVQVTPILRKGQRTVLKRQTNKD